MLSTLFLSYRKQKLDIFDQLKYFCFFSCLAATNYYYFRTEGQWNFQEFIGTTDVMNMVFEVMATNKTQVALMYDPKNKDGMLFQILIL